VELKPVLRHLWRWGWLLVLSAVLAGLVGLLASRWLTPVYRATTTVLVGERTRGDQPVTETLNRSQLLAETYIQLLKSRPVLDAVIAQLNLPMNREKLARKISARAVPGTQLVRISAESSSAEQAALLAHTAAQALHTEGTPLLGNSWHRATLSIVEPAAPPLRPVFPRTPLNVAIAGMLGMLIASGLIVLRQTIYGLVETPEDVQRRTGLEPLTMVPAGRRTRPTQALVFRDQPDSSAAEAYRHLRSRVIALPGDGGGEILAITSDELDVPTSAVAANLAISLAQAGRRVILVDAKLRRPSLHRYFGHENNHGLTSILRQHAEERTEHLLVTTTTPNLQLLPAGPSHAASAELLASCRFAELIAHLRLRAEVVVIDCGPAHALADGLDAARTSNAALLVARPGISRAPALASLRNRLESSGVRVLGIVLIGKPAPIAMPSGSMSVADARVSTIDVRAQSTGD